MENNSSINELREKISKSRKILLEIDRLNYNLDIIGTLEEKKIIFSQINELRSSLKKNNQELAELLNGVSFPKILPKKYEPEKEKAISPRENVAQEKNVREKILPSIPKGELKKFEISEIEKETLKRLNKKRKIIFEKPEKKSSSYIKISNRFFSDASMKLEKSEMFRQLKRDLIKSNLGILPVSYISVLLFTVGISFFVSIFVTLFFTFFNFGFSIPLITLVENVSGRILKTIWLLVAIPVLTFVVMYFYPSVEKDSAERKINQELPFVAIHMAAIAGAMVEPSRIFSIIISTNDYPNVQKEFVKVINEINIYGYDLVSVLRNVAFNNSSSKLAELLNGMATTITSGGDLAEFFEKRAESLLFDHRLEREKYTKSAETFIDIYISVVIAAPMIIMLLIMMMKISGMGIGFSAGTITFLMILAVCIINILFIAFMSLKQPSG